MNRHRADDTLDPPVEDGEATPPPHDLPLSAWVFGGVFAAAGLWHLVYDATHKGYGAAQLTIFLFSGGLLILGYPIGKLVARK